MLTPVLRRGQPVREQPSLESIRERVQRQLSMLQPDIKRLENPRPYLAGMELGLHELKKQLVLAVKTKSASFRPANVFKPVQATDQNR